MTTDSISELKVRVYGLVDSIQADQAEQYTKTTKAIAEYVGRVYGPEMTVLVSVGKESVPVTDEKAKYHDDVQRRCRCCMYAGKQRKEKESEGERKCCKCGKTGQWARPMYNLAGVADPWMSPLHGATSMPKIEYPNACAKECVGGNPGLWIRCRKLKTILEEAYGWIAV